MAAYLFFLGGIFLFVKADSAVYFLSGDPLSGFAAFFINAALLAALFVSLSKSLFLIMAKHKPLPKLCDLWPVSIIGGTIIGVIVLVSGLNLSGFCYDKAAFISDNFLLDKMKTKEQAMYPEINFYEGCCVVLPQRFWMSKSEAFLAKLFAINLKEAYVFYESNAKYVDYRAVFNSCGEIKEENRKSISLRELNTWGGLSDDLRDTRLDIMRKNKVIPPFDYSY